MKCVTKIKASVLSFVLAFGLMLTPAVLAYAAEGDASDETNSGQTGVETPTPDYTASWTVTFNGNEMISDDHQYNQVIRGLQPGDTARFEIELVNDCDQEVDWYVANRIEDSMEQTDKNGNEVEGNGEAAYAYTLTYLDGENETVIYSNDKVGGMQENQPALLSDELTPLASKEATSGGLINVTENSGMNDYFHLGTFAPKTTKQMVLTMGIDGETHTNGYFDTDAGAWLQYAAEPVGPGEEIITTERTTTYEPVPRTVGGDLPQTGDMLPTITMICLILGLIVLVCGIVSWVNDRKSAQRGQE